MKSDTLQGSYTVFPNLPNGVLTNQGGVPSGYFDDINNQYWTYVHSNNAGSVVIRRAVHSDFNSQLTSFSTVLSGPIIGETFTTTTESPGITLNTFLLTNVELVNDNIPVKFSLVQNYPNPFNPSTTIEYSIPTVETRHALSVQLKIYDILGREVAVLINEQQQPGYYKVNFDASALSSGMYFYRIIAGKFVQTKKMVLLK
ncbi:MAG TPA: T9SS type A sorting domain-containing protein [Ignavibacteria bacterium]|nr:T9SS type A sorting domain-containing protein [Ignavibacteria bacterium]